MDNYYLERLNDNNAVKWEEFNNNSSEGTFFHSLKWKQIFENTSEYKTHFFLLFKNSSVFGIFPFVEHKIPLLEKYKSLRFDLHGLFPFPTTGHNNIIIRDFADSSAIQYSIQEIPKLMRTQNKISFINIASLHKEASDNLKNCPIIFPEIYGNMILDLRNSSPEDLWENFTAKKGQRRYIRRFDEKGYTTTEINSCDGLKLFYKYYLENMNFIGVVPPTFSHFNNLWNNLSSNEMRITLLSNDTSVAGGVLMFPYKPAKTVYLKYLSLNRNLPNTYHPTYYLYWEAINWAWNNEYEKISFGTEYLNENNPHFRIKKEFGGVFEPIYPKIIPLTKTLIIGCKCKRFIRSLHLFT